MKHDITGILSDYDLCVGSVESVNEDNDVFKITDCSGKPYFLKLYGAAGGDDFMPADNIYHTYEQIKLEA